MNDTPQATAAPRVLELAGNAGTAWAARLLADHGADVIKVEHPKGGDSTRSFTVSNVEGQSTYFMQINHT